MEVIIDVSCMVLYEFQNSTRSIILYCVYQFRLLLQYDCLSQFFDGFLLLLLGLGIDTYRVTDIDGALGLDHTMSRILELTQNRRTAFLATNFEWLDSFVFPDSIDLFIILL